MGYSISWLAIRGKRSLAVQRELALSGTGEYEEIPESPLLGAELPEGWYLVFANRCDYADNAPLARLSRGGEIITCALEEHVMYSTASGWKDGRILWSVTHDAQQGVAHLETEGKLPGLFDSIREQLTTEQVKGGDVDYIIDIPIELARQLTGFQHDGDIARAPDKPFERLVSHKRWWEIWK